MLKLVLKDFQIQKKSFIYYAFIAIFLSVFFAAYGMVQMSFTMIIFPVIYGFINRALYEDEKNNTLRLLASLPIHRETMVYARYISAAAMVLIMTLVCTIVNICMSVFGVYPSNEININFIILAVSILVMVIIMSIYLPIAFKLGYIKAATINRFLFIGIFSASTAAGMVLQKKTQGPPPEFIVRLGNMLQSMSMPEIIIIVAITAVCMFLVSMEISIRLFEKRNLF